jgi:hypothetical protein
MYKCSYSVAIKLQLQIEHEIKLKYFNVELKIGLVLWREAYVSSPEGIRMTI